MINLESASFIVSTLTFILAYLITVTCAGAFRAWVATLVGDSTAKDVGFLTLNPLAHIDFFGMFFLIFFHFGWGRVVPINPYNIYKPWRKLKLFLAYCSDSIAHILIALSLLIVLLSSYGSSILYHARYMILFHDLSHLRLANIYIEHSSLAIALAFIFIAIIYLSVVLAVLNLIINLTIVGAMILAERNPSLNIHSYYTTILIPILLIWFFSGPLRIIVLHLIITVGLALARLFGIA